MLLVIDGESGGVGKSTTTKLLLEYLIEAKKSYKVYDLDLTKLDVGVVYDPENYKKSDIVAEGENKPEQTADLSRLIRFTDKKRDRSKVNVIFEEALKENVVVNLPSNVKHLLDSWIEDNGLLKLALTNKIKFIKIFVCSGDKLSVDLFLDSLEKYKNDQGMTQIFCYNEKYESDIETLKTKYKKLKDALEMHKVATFSLPELDWGCFDRINDMGTRFSTAKDDPSNDLGMIGRQSVAEFLNKSSERYADVLKSIGATELCTQAKKK
ncbi:MAG: hypothetical protein QNJ72_45215 [Pleurocapsa sp. MO_226.B13]|nr:hypothetical protein [Pleurocapsa sp. MO_226.B13]